MMANTDSLTHQRLALSVTSYGQDDMAKAVDMVLPNGSATALSVADGKGMLITDSRVIVANRTSADEPWQPLQQGDASTVAFHAFTWLERQSDEAKRSMCSTRPLNPPDAPRLIGWSLVLDHGELDGEPCRLVRITPAWYS